MKKTLSTKAIEKISEKLGHFLSDTFVLYVKTLNFHWNMVGKEFYMYHRLLQKQYEELQEAIDELAERIRMLGKKAPGSMRHFLKLACLKESEETLSAKKMVEELVQSHQELVEHCHAIIKFTDEMQDQGTSDLLIERLRFHDKQAWLLKSHLEV